MGTRIAFRPRARGGAAGDGDFVSALEPRWKFAKGVKSTPGSGEVEVGAGTLYPVKVTLDQMFAIAYRVKDARVTGSVTLDLWNSETVEFLFTSDDPTLQDNWYDDSSGDYTHRAYAVGGVDADDETQMWADDLDTPFFGDTPTGLSHDSDTINTGGPFSGYCFHSTDRFGDNGGYFYLQFSGEVAVYDPLGVSQDPFDPNNELWVGLYIEAGDYYWLPSGVSSEQSSGDSHVVDISIQLSNSSTIDVPIFADANVTEGTSSMVVEATEWWPYAKPAGGNFWNTTTGLGA